MYIDALKNSLTTNATSVKNALEAYVRENGGTAMPETDGYGHSTVSDLPLGLYLFVETRVPEMVTETTAPFLVSLPMTSTADKASWLYNVTLYPKNLTGIPTLEKTVREAKSSSGKNNGKKGACLDKFSHSFSSVQCISSVISGGISILFALYLLYSFSAGMISVSGKILLSYVITAEWVMVAISL